MAAALKIEGEMVKAMFISRTSRFSVLAELVDLGSGSEKFECHLPNPGRLKELLVPGASTSPGPQKIRTGARPCSTSSPW